ncbi:zinc finger protein 664 isoform X9 [Balaenoptera acutorostrata]|uniref:Zinc finger protein 664 isoform X9 n=1 Tax=Balaenoptera acutorostrata TaxID=9767 RepID=A0ABM3S0I1_BALAC|nr:zinc finger protein 664 isoform X9 [Balaenoptera acutorostrata]
MGGAAGGAGSRPPALPRPGRRGRSVGTARRAHLAGSHPSARRGARWERGPGRRGLSALTGRAAEAPARRRSASRPSRASRASYSGDEEPSRHPAQIAAAAGRLHCLTITRAGFSPSSQGMLTLGPWRPVDHTLRAADLHDDLEHEVTTCVWETELSVWREKQNHHQLLRRSPK